MLLLKLRDCGLRKIYDFLLPLRVFELYQVLDIHKSGVDDCAHFPLEHVAFKFGDWAHDGNLLARPLLDGVHCFLLSFQLDLLLKLTDLFVQDHQALLAYISRESQDFLLVKVFWDVLVLLLHIPISNG